MCVCVSTWSKSVDGQLATLWAPRLQSICDPRWQLLCQMGFSWRLQPLSVTRLHVFVFVVDGVCECVCVWTIVIKLCVLFVCVCVCKGGACLEPRCTENMLCCHMGRVQTWLHGCREPSLASCTEGKGGNVFRFGVRLFPHCCHSH